MTRRKLTNKQRAEIQLRQGGRCPVCGNHLRHPNIDYDHELALSRGGMDTLDNIRAICAYPCHSTKTDGAAHCRLGADKFEAAKTKRLIAKRSAPAKPSRMKGQGFRGWRSFSGKVVWNKQS